MKVLVDTCVWTLVLRRRRTGLSAEERVLTMTLAELIRDDRVVLVGPVVQELLSGVPRNTEFDRLRARLDDFPDVGIERQDFEEAAKCHNVCRANGVAGSTIDFLLCAVAIRNGWAILTTDADFIRYAGHLPLTLHQPGSAL
ncbi:MAG: PIN domain-containing protein [Planctomycetaceae bacterium]|nr:PIN domain-containing protein [Planctomycetaceae bacterium]